jgi:hypothetical protein
VRVPGSEVGVAWREDLVGYSELGIPRDEPLVLSPLRRIRNVGLISIAIPPNIDPDGPVRRWQERGNRLRHRVPLSGVKP